MFFHLYIAMFFATLVVTAPSKYRFLGANVKVWGLAGVSPGKVRFFVVVGILEWVVRCSLFFIGMPVHFFIGVRKALRARSHDAEIHYEASEAALRKALEWLRDAPVSDRPFVLVTVKNSDKFIQFAKTSWEMFIDLGYQKVEGVEKLEGTDVSSKPFKTVTEGAMLAYSILGTLLESERATRAAIVLQISCQVDLGSS